MAENERVVRAAEALVFRELLVPERDPRRVEVALDGRGFRYAAAFWDKAGVRSSAAAADEARLSVAVEWVAAGAPLWWARTEAERALERFVSSRARESAGERSRDPSGDAGRACAEGESPCPIPNRSAC